jgi:hypothetical protein
VGPLSAARAAALLVPLLLAGCGGFNLGPAPMFVLGPVTADASAAPRVFLDLVDTRAPWDRCTPAWPLPSPVYPAEADAAPLDLFAPPRESPPEDWADPPVLLTGQGKGAFRALHALRLAIVDEDKGGPAARSGPEGGRHLGDALSFFSIGLWKTW